jgi:chitin disaccharide deacetylase
MAILHVNADDFGLHADIDRGIIACVDAGRVTGVSVAANGQAIDWPAVRELARRVHVGVHATLVGEPWLTRTRFFTSWSTLVPWLMWPGHAGLLEREVRAQVDSMLQAGVTPTHLDSHQHVHVMPTVWPVVSRVAKEYSIARVRVPATPDRSIAKQSVAGRVLQRLSEWRQTDASLPCIGIAQAGHNTAARLIAELEAARGADVELVAHPGIDTPGLQARYPAWKFDWRTELAALMSPEWGEAVARLGYRFEG